MNMLSKENQMFLMGLLMGRNTRKKQTVYYSLAFYRAITYLKRNKLVKSEKQEKGMENTYMLTLKGGIIAKLLAGLSGSPEEFREKSIT
jgi:hypothetical protein